MPTILITDPITKDARSALSSFAVEYQPEITQKVLRSTISTADAVICRARTKLGADVLAQASNLKIIANASTGTDHIDLEYCKSHDITVATVEIKDGMTPNTIATAEHTALLILAALKQLKPAMHSAVSGNWQTDLPLGNELHNKTVGIIGLGKIGQFVAKRITPFGATVIASDPIVSEDVAINVGATLLPLDDLLAQADVITLHVPSIPQTIGMINQESLAKTKKGVIIINTSRGKIIDSAALQQALDTGHVSRAALDVFTKETATENDVLLTHPNVLATPHIAGITEESLNRMSHNATQAILAFFQNANSTDASPE